MCTAETSGQVDGRGDPKTPDHGDLKDADQSPGCDCGANAPASKEYEKECAQHFPDKFDLKRHGSRWLSGRRGNRKRRAQKHV